MILTNFDMLCKTLAVINNEIHRWNVPHHFSCSTFWGF